MLSAGALFLFSFDAELPIYIQNICLCFFFLCLLVFFSYVRRVSSVSALVRRIFGLEKDLVQHLSCQFYGVKERLC